jgi:hypothetical protein
MNLVDGRELNAKQVLAPERKKKVGIIQISNQVFHTVIKKLFRGY